MLVSRTWGVWPWKLQKPGSSLTGVLSAGPISSELCPGPSPSRCFCHAYGGPTEASQGTGTSRLCPVDAGLACPDMHLHTGPHGLWNLPEKNMVGAMGGRDALDHRVRVRALLRSLCGLAWGQLKAGRSHHWPCGHLPPQPPGQGP